jgi:hypothetical protein
MGKFYKLTLDGPGDARKAIEAMNKVAGLKDVFQGKLGKGGYWVD